MFGGALTYKERSSLELTGLERAAEHSGSGWKAQHPTPSPLATQHFAQKLQVVEQAHRLSLGEGLLGRLQRQHLDIEPANGLSVVEVLQSRERLL